MNKILTTINKDGSLPLTPVQQAYLLNNAGRRVSIEVIKTKRTLSQNAYVHVLFEYISQFTGDNFASIKTIEKRRHLKPVEVKIFDQRHLTLPSTADLSNLEMSGFIEKVLADCAFLGIIVPTRQELGYSPK